MPTKEELVEISELVEALETLEQEHRLLDKKMQPWHWLMMSSNLSNPIDTETSELNPKRSKKDLLYEFLQKKSQVSSTTSRAVSSEQEMLKAIKKEMGVLESTGLRPSMLEKLHKNHSSFIYWSVKN